LSFIIYNQVWLAKGETTASTSSIDSGISRKQSLAVKRQSSNSVQPGCKLRDCAIGKTSRHTRKLLEMLAVEVTKPAPKAAACCLVMTISISIQVGEALIEFHCPARTKIRG
jgi:hypothetical protein